MVDGLGVEEQKSVAVVVAMLEERGATLPFPTAPASLVPQNYANFACSTAANRTGYSMPLTPNAMQSCCWAE